MPKSVVTDPTGLCARDSLYHALGMRVDGSATRATVLRPPRHRSPRATEDGGGIANPGCNGDMQHGSAPPRAQLGQTWFIDHEAHLLQNRFIVNSNSPKIDLLRRSLATSYLGVPAPPSAGLPGQLCESGTLR